MTCRYRALSIIQASWQGGVELKYLTGCGQIAYSWTLGRDPLVFDTRQQNHLPSATVRIGDNHALSSTTVRDFGIPIDNNVAMQSHVSCTVSGCLLCYDSSAASDVHVWFCVRRCLLVVLPVMPRLDYSNATLAVLLASQLRRLQSVLNAADRLVHPSSRYEHITPMLRDFRWLQSPECIDFKFAVLIYRCLNGLAPWYLSNDIQRAADSNCCRLQSSSSSQIAIRRTWLSTVSDRAFPVAGSCLWNSLPPAVTSAPMLCFFWNHLKTYLFSRSFSF